MEWKPVSWKISDSGRSGLVDPLITETEGKYVVRYGAAALSSGLEWVPSPKTAVQARRGGLLCDTLEEAQQRFSDWEMLHEAARSAGK